MINIIEIIPSLEKKGGAEVLLIGLIKEMSKMNDVSVHLICLYDGIDNSFLDILNDCGNVSLTFCSKRKGIDFKCAHKLKHTIKQIKPDIIHMHLSCLPTLFLAYPFGLKRVKLFQTVHSIPTMDSHGLNKMLRIFYCKRRRMRLVGISMQITGGIFKMFPFLLSRDQVFTVFNGTAIMDSTITAKSKTNDLICVASVKPIKNQKMLLNCVSQLKQKYPTIRVAILGEGEQLSEMINYSTHLSLSNNVTFYGAVDNVHEHLHNSKIFVLTSIYEGNPISILEALSCGLPCVVPNVGGIPDVINTGENGLLFEVGNESEFVYNVSRLLEDGNLYNRLSHNAKISAKKYDISNCAKKYVELFKEN